MPSFPPRSKDQCAADVASSLSAFRESIIADLEPTPDETVFAITFDEKTSALLCGSQCPERIDHDWERWAAFWWSRRRAGQPKSRDANIASTPAPD